MDTLKIFKDSLKEHLSLFSSIDNLGKDIDDLFHNVITTLENGKTILVCGNGGSAADSQHFASELTGRFNKERLPLSSISLTTDSSAITCIGNDYSYDHIFSRQVEGVGKEGDLLILITTSGNSKNLLMAAKSAKNKKIKTFGLLGKGGGELVKHVESSIVVPSNSTARVQETHIFILHLICEMIDEMYAGKNE